MTNPIFSEPASASRKLASADELIDEMRNGRMVILVDDEDRENEGDLIIPAQLATPEAVNFMAKFGRGLICLCLTAERTRQLELELMVRENGTRHQTAFTTSIEARYGIDTGISAVDRARTISVAIDAKNGPDQIVTPGHVFPLIARDGGVLVRAGHTEAAVDLARLANLNPSAVICEIMNDDGSMARLDDLIFFGKVHNIKVGTIKDLILHRRQHDRIVERVSERDFETERYGKWTAIAFRNLTDSNEYLALVKGNIVPGQPTMVRMHVPDILADVCGAKGPREKVIETAMEMMSAAGQGVICLLPAKYGAGGGLLSRIAAPDAARTETLREYGIGAQILADLGVGDIELLTSSHPDPVALSAYGLAIVGERPLQTSSS